nr:hypothetical protein CFP56_50196 [Quercus suber]
MAGVNHEQVKVLRGEVYELMVKEDCLWHQRSRVDWLKSEDMNIGYFHRRASQCNKRNFISTLILDDGLVVEDSKKIGEAFVDYFNNIFTSSSPSSYDQILQDRVVAESAPHEATAILGIPMSSTRPEDKLIWTATPNGCHSTKSAYHLLSN